MIKDAYLIVGVFFRSINSDYIIGLSVLQIALVSEEVLGEFDYNA